jgi:3-phenylpropionate/cinnamic acid dioxygenase small subunit
MMSCNKFSAIFAAITLLVTGLAAQMTAAESQNDGMQLFRDRLAIEKTLQAYVFGLDGSDLEGYLATLADDARFLSKEGNHIGKKAIADYVRPVMEARKKSVQQGTAASKRTHHVITNISMEFIDSTHAVVRSYWMYVVAHTTGGNTIDSMGSSVDRLVKQGDKWLIYERQVETM